MATGAIKTRTVVLSLAVISGTEALARLVILWGGAPPPLMILGIVRVVQIAGIVGLLRYFEKGLASIAWSPASWRRGAIKGALWSLCFAAIAGLGLLIVFLLGENPLAMLRFPLPQEPKTLGLYLFVGGFIGPLAEEIFFRGLLYTYFRKWSALFALIASTALFVGLHVSHGAPLILIVGGIVFAVAYETSRNLMAPIFIHITGNLALFGLSLAPRLF